MIIPKVICTDIFENPWIDQVENAYNLSFTNESVSNIILFDVWHHLKFPGNALAEFYRVLKPGGRIIIFEPSMSFIGFLVYGLLHHEPVAYFKKIPWFAADSKKPDNEYYAAQGNASRIFGRRFYRDRLNDWEIKKIKRYASFSYILSGGYSKNQLYPDRLLPVLQKVDSILNLLPSIFATRMLVVLEKK
jgi:SAM-dependent methyltransferase